MNLPQPAAQAWPSGSGGGNSSQRLQHVIQLLSAACSQRCLFVIETRRRAFYFRGWLGVPFLSADPATDQPESVAGIFMMDTLPAALTID